MPASWSSYGCSAEASPSGTSAGSCTSRTARSTATRSRSTASSASRPDPMHLSTRASSASSRPRSTGTSRAVRVLPFVGLVAVLFSVAVNGASGRSDAAPTLVVDNSFALDTTDPASGARSDLNDRRPRPLRHALHLQGKRSLASGTAPRSLLVEERHRAVHLSAQEERAFRRRDAADRRRRRLLAQASRQPAR